MIELFLQLWVFGIILEKVVLSWFCWAVALIFGLSIRHLGLQFREEKIRSVRVLISSVIVSFLFGSLFAWMGWSVYPFEFSL